MILRRFVFLPGPAAIVTGGTNGDVRGTIIRCLHQKRGCILIIDLPQSSRLNDRITVVLKQ